MGSEQYKFSRHAMYIEIEKFFSKEERIGKVIFLGESIKDHKVSKIREMFSPEAEKIVTHYPEVDMLDMPYVDNSVDFIVSDQVLEHTVNPFTAVEEAYRVLRPEGWLILCTCLMMHVHMYPNDYWRFTPEALKILCKDFKHVDQCNAMGSYNILKECEEGNKRNKLVELDTKLEKIAMQNDNKYWTHVWIIAQK